MKKLAIDNYYSGEDAFSVGVIFDSLKLSSTPEFIFSCHSEVKDNYVSGEFFKRELPPIQKLIKTEIGLDWLKKNVDLIIVDGFYTLLDENTGLGKFLDNWLISEGVEIEVMGVAKTKAKNCELFSQECIRGKHGTTKPLWTNGSEKGKNYSGMLKNMKGEYRLPDILKYLDDLTKGKK